jgi:hypothetical protein
MRTLRMQQLSQEHGSEGQEHFSLRIHGQTSVQAKQSALLQRR